MLLSSLLIAGILLLISPGIVLPLPTGCTSSSFTSLMGLETLTAVTCDYSSWSPPLLSSDLVYFPQSLTITNVNGEIASSTFDDLQNSNRSGLSNVDPVEFIISCGGNSLQPILNSFAGLYNLFDKVTISNCNSTLNTTNSGLGAFGTLDTLKFDAGSAILGSSTFSDLQIKRNEALLDPSGKIDFSNVKLTETGLLPNEIFSHLTSISEISLGGAGLTSLASSTFSGLTKVNKLTLSQNPFSSLESNLFSDNSGLQTVVLEDIAWECSCANTWIVEWAESNHASLEGDLRCATPSSREGKRLVAYYHDTCKAAPQTEPAFYIDVYYFTAKETAHMILTVIIFIMVIVATHVSRKSAIRLAVIEALEEERTLRRLERQEKLRERREELARVAAEQWVKVTKGDEADGGLAEDVPPKKEGRKTSRDSRKVSPATTEVAKRDDAFQEVTYDELGYDDFGYDKNGFSPKRTAPITPGDAYNNAAWD